MAEPETGLVGGSFAGTQAGRVGWFGAALRSRLVVAAITVGAVLFPIIVRNDGHIDAAANALTFAALALGLNIVVGLAGLLDLGYAAHSY